MGKHGLQLVLCNSRLLSRITGQFIIFLWLLVSFFVFFLYSLILFWFPAVDYADLCAYQFF